jgi:hypothetical protein
MLNAECIGTEQNACCVHSFQRPKPSCFHLRSYSCVCTCRCVCVCCVCVCMCEQSNPCSFVHECVCVYIYIYTHTATHHVDKNERERDQLPTNIHVLVCRAHIDHLLIGAVGKSLNGKGMMWVSAFLIRADDAGPRRQCAHPRARAYCYKHKAVHSNTVCLPTWFVTS